MVLHGIHLDAARIALLCRRAGVRRAFVFGSILSDRFADRSDIDLLIEIDPHNPPGLLTLGGLQADLSDLLGRPVHLTLLGGVPPEERPALLAKARSLDAA